MYLNRAELKYRARQAMRSSAVSPYIMALVYSVIAYVMGLLSARLLNVDVVSVVKHLGPDVVMENPEIFINYYISRAPGAFAYFIELLLRIMGMLLYAGQVVFILNMVRGLQNSLWNLMDGFQSFLRIIGLRILMAIFVFLWSLLFVIPGIVAAYRYRLALYLLLDHPEMGVMECIRESKRLMRGHKAELFILDLSFIGWALLSVIPFVSIYTIPYTEATYALYYCQLAAQPHEDWYAPRDNPGQTSKKRPHRGRFFFDSGTAAPRTLTPASLRSASPRPVPVSRLSHVAGGGVLTISPAASRTR